MNYQKYYQSDVMTKSKSLTGFKLFADLISRQQKLQLLGKKVKGRLPYMNA